MTTVCEEFTMTLAQAPPTLRKLRRRDQRRECDAPSFAPRYASWPCEHTDSCGQPANWDGNHAPAAALISHPTSSAS